MQMKRILKKKSFLGYISLAAAQDSFSALVFCVYCGEASVCPSKLACPSLHKYTKRAASPTH